MSSDTFENYSDVSNQEILDYFSKFSDRENYLIYYQNLDELSKIRVKGELEVGDLKMPYIGPSDDLSTFPETIKNWEKEDIFELKNVIKLYDSGEIESIEEAVILIEIMKRKNEYPKILDTILSDLKSGTLKNIESYSDVLMSKNEDTDSIIYGSIWKYLITLTCE